MYNFIPITYLNYINKGGASKRHELILIIHLFSEGNTIKFSKFKEIQTEDGKLNAVLNRLLHNPDVYSKRLQELQKLGLIKIHYHYAEGRDRKFSTLTLKGAARVYENFEYYYLYHKKTKNNERFLNIIERKVEDIKAYLIGSVKAKERELNEFSIEQVKAIESKKTGKNDLISLRKIIQEFSGDFEDNSLDLILDKLNSLTRGEYLSLFPPEIAELLDIELYLNKYSVQKHSFKAYFPKSSLLDDKDDNMLWFKISYNKITGVVFHWCEFADNAIWAEVFTKLSKLKHLERLLINNTEMSKLPSSAGELRNLKILVVEHSHLKELPASLGNLVNLEQIDFSHNSLESLPRSIENMVSLEEVYLGDNLLVDLPQNIFALHELREIHLERNLFVDPKSLLARFNARGINAFI